MNNSGPGAGHDFDASLAWLLDGDNDDERLSPSLPAELSAAYKDNVALIDRAYRNARNSLRHTVRAWLDTLEVAGTNRLLFLQFTPRDDIGAHDLLRVSVASAQQPQPLHLTRDTTSRRTWRTAFELAFELPRVCPDLYDGTAYAWALDTDVLAVWTTTTYFHDSGTTDMHSWTQALGDGDADGGAGLQRLERTLLRTGLLPE